MARASPVPERSRTVVTLEKLGIHSKTTPERRKLQGELQEGRQMAMMKQLVRLEKEQGEPKTTVIHARSTHLSRQISDPFLCSRITG